MQITFKYLKYSILTSLFLVIGCSSVKKTLNTQLQKDPLKNSFHGLVVVDAHSQKTLYDQNGDRYFLPASNTKVVTFYTGVKMLPKNIPTLKYAVSNDTLFMEGTGDPSWLHPHLKDSTAIQWLKKQGTIALYLNNIEEDRYGPGWAWEDYDTYFSPERGSLPLYANVVTLSAVDSLQVSPSYFAESVSLQKKPKSRVEFSNQFFIDPKEQDTLEVPYITDKNITKALLETVLEKEIVLVDHFPDTPKQTLYGMETDSIYKQMLYKSDNFLAEQLLIAASSTISDTLGTKRAMDYMLEHDYSDLSQKPRWVDGSGLSRYNLFTPRSFVEILQKLHNEVPEERLFGIFPMWGPSSTVKEWEDPTTEPFLFAKSGSFGNNYNLSGYVKTKSGKLLIFSFMNNHFRIPSSEVRKTMYETLKKLYLTY
ncbi:D-alanyl-D-alanine carboxypeptidase [Flagellimonas olearia]|uniref:D-alanyl-D-alanine carboxypeptidase n=1 Tax=Flagellimonas olearia TaxID=552546 RepID=A0A6I1EBG7_9FLAO|nr:D-alanyl-D-alanine carboxypeptidase [Allomuricauda olearia]KAB7531114.1 D-alanyl-D-alanine carboxypeptidase [Allomuricauda olearia]